MLGLLQAAFSFLLGLVEVVKRYNDYQKARKEISIQNELVISEKGNYADSVYNNADKLPDELLLSPEQRNSGRVQDLQADICGNCRGGGGCKDFASVSQNKGAQQSLGKQLPEFRKPERWVRKVYIHCSASDNPAHDNVEVISQWHRARGWAGIGYHYYVDKSGVVHQGRDVEKIPAAQQGFNTGSIAICCGGEKEFTAQQMAALKGFCSKINKAYDGVVTFHGHCEVSTKTCPNFDYRKVLGIDEKGRMA